MEIVGKLIIFFFGFILLLQLVSSTTLTYSDFVILDLNVSDSLLVNNNDVCLNNTLGCPFILESLDCVVGMVPKYNGTDWNCFMENVFSVSKPGTIVKSNGTDWLHGNDEDTYSAKNCISNNKKLVYYSSSWNCVSEYDGWINSGNDLYFLGSVIIGSNSYSTSDTNPYFTINGPSKFVSSDLLSNISFFDDSESLLKFKSLSDDYSIKFRGVIESDKSITTSFFSNDVGLQFIISNITDSTFNSIEFNSVNNNYINPFKYYYSNTDNSYSLNVLNSLYSGAITSSGNSQFYLGDLNFDYQDVIYSDSVYFKNIRPNILLEASSFALACSSLESCIESKLGTIKRTHLNDCFGDSGDNYYLLACVSNENDGPHWYVLAQD